MVKTFNNDQSDQIKYQRQVSISQTQNLSIRHCRLSYVIHNAGLRFKNVLFGNVGE